MNTKTMASLFVLLAIVSIAVTVPTAYAAHADEAYITMAEGSGVPGCEETPEGCFLPSTVTIAAGGHVEWENTDNTMHFATSGDGATMTPDGVFDSGMMNPGQTFSFTFEEAGTYPYYCMVHAWMVGTIIVEDDDHHAEEEAAAAAAAEAAELAAAAAEAAELAAAEAAKLNPEDIVISVPDSADANEVVAIDVTIGDSHVTYDIVATHNGETILDESGVHSHTGEGSHTTSALSAPASGDNPIDVTVTFQGFGMPSGEKTGPIGLTNTAQVVPEFGTIAAMILAIAIVSIIAVTAKSRLSIMPRL